MSIVDDVVKQILTYSGKTGTENEAVAKGRVLGTITSINLEMDNFTVTSRDKTIAVAKDATTVNMPAKCEKIIELGRYDSTTDRISTVYEEISEQEFHANMSGADSIGTITPTSQNQWCILDDTSAGVIQIRLVYPPSSAFTMEARYFEKLTENNIDKLPTSDILYNGAVARLGQWFPNDAGLCYKLYSDAIASLKVQTRSIKRTLRKQVAPHIAAHNMTMGAVVD